MYCFRVEEVCHICHMCSLEVCFGHKTEGTRTSWPSQSCGLLPSIVVSTPQACCLNSLLSLWIHIPNLRHGEDGDHLRRRQEGPVDP